MNAAPLSAALLLAVLPSALVAQIISATAPVVGWVSTSPLPAAGAIDVQDMTTNCLPAKTLCTKVLASNAVTYAGGTAYDPRHQSVWVSDGKAMEEWELATCKTICKVAPSIMRSGAVVSGLAVSTRRQMLYHLETMPGYLGILPWNNSKCPPVPTKGGCNMTIPKSATAGGLAYDEKRDLLYFVVSAPGVTGVVNTLYAGSPTGACRPICNTVIKDCGSATFLGSVTGLAFDACLDRLYATDGKTTRRMLLTDPTKCLIKYIDCCAKLTGTGVYRGLALIPGWSQVQVGKPCFSSGCQSCPSMRVEFFGGDPVPGNPDFGVKVAGGPSNAVATLAVSLGSCTKGVPFLCGNLYLPGILPPLIVPLGTLSGTQCNARAKLGLPLASNLSLCGLRLCLQALVLCPAGGGFYPR